MEGKRRGWWKTARLSGGHRDVKATACPGRYAYAAIPEINRRAAALENGDDDMTPQELLTHRVPLSKEQRKYFGNLPSISLKGLWIYAGMGGWMGRNDSKDSKDIDRILAEVLEAEKRDLEAAS